MLRGLFSNTEGSAGLPSMLNAAFLTAIAALTGSPTSPTSGCGIQSPWSFDATHHSNQTLADRSFLVHLPPSYDPNVPHPVVLSFHGYGNNDAHHEQETGFSQDNLKIHGQSIIAVYPLASRGPGKPSAGHQARAWQGAPYSKPGVDDIAFTKRILSELKANLCVDEKRIYAAGHSNGGGFTNLLACTHSTASHFAAFALLSPALYPGTLPLVGCQPQRKVPILALHGHEDHIIPFHGRDADKHGDHNYALPAISAFREAWAKRNGCKNPKVPTSVSHPHELTTLKVWNCSPDDTSAIVKGYLIRGWGHEWPNTSKQPPATFDATPDEVVPFFSAHALV